MRVDLNTSWVHSYARLTLVKSFPWMQKSEFFPAEIQTSERWSEGPQGPLSCSQSSSCSSRFESNFSIPCPCFMLSWGSSGQLSQATCSNTHLMPSASQVIHSARSSVQSEMLGNSYNSDHTETLGFNSKNSSTHPCWWWGGYVYSAGCSSVSRLLIQMHVLVAPFTSQSFSFCRREIPWYVSLEEIAPGARAG